MNGITNYRILIVDDDRITRKIYQKILSQPSKDDVLLDESDGGTRSIVRKQYELTFASNGVDGILEVEKAHKHKKPFAVAFIDMNMPGLNGAEASKRIWLIDPGIKIVIVTANNAFGLDDIIRVTGKDEIFYLRKPFAPGEIRQFSRALAWQWNLEREREWLNTELKNEIKEHQRVNELLEETQARFRSISESANDAIVMADHDGTICFWNNVAHTIFGYSSEEAIGKKVHTLLSPERYRQAANTAYLNFKKTGNRRSAEKLIELMAKNRDGQEIPIELSLASILLKGQWHAVAIIRDITERKKAEVELKDAREAAETAHKKLVEIRKNEISIAARIQKTLLLGDPPKDLNGIEIDQITIPSQKVDGDFYDFYKSGDRSLDVLVGDVMGKGVPSALVGAAVKSYFLRVFNNQKWFECVPEIPQPEDIVASVHSGMIDQLEELETFVTLCFARFDLSRQRFKFVDCGHMRTIHYRRESDACELLQGVNMPLGFPEIEPFTQLSVSFRPGDLFFFYSDGVTEAQDTRGDMYGEARLVDFIQKNAKNNFQNLIGGLTDEVVAFSGNDNFADDFTLVAVRIGKGASHPGSSPELRFEFKSDFKELARVRSLVRDFCESIPGILLSDDHRDLAILAVNEAATNIIKHAYEGRPEEPIHLLAEVAADRLNFRLYDWGKDFEPASVQEPEFNGSKEGGFGVYIIKQSVDQVHYSRDANGRNCIELIINFAGGK